MGKKPPVIAVAGPTASGKSDLGLKLARCLGGEIVCMDSMQIYRRMDIGTAKPTTQERALVPHHMLDVADPTEAYAVADYAGGEDMSAVGERREIAVALETLYRTAKEDEKH